MPEEQPPTWNKHQNADTWPLVTIAATAHQQDKTVLQTREFQSHLIYLETDK